MLQSIDVTPIALLSMSLHCIQHSTDAVHGIVLGYTTSTDSNNNDDTSTTQSINKYIITDVVPILHGTTITVPIIEIAYGLLTHIVQRLNTNDVQNNNNSTNSNKIQILGWYTSPMLLPNNQSPNPILLRIMSNLASAAAAAESSSTNGNTLLIVSDPILLVVQNETFTSYITGEGENSSSSSSTNSQLFQIYTNNGSKGHNNEYMASKDNITINVKQQQQPHVSNKKNSNNDVYMTLLSAIAKAKDQKIRILDLMDYYTAMEDISASMSTTKGTTNTPPNNKEIQWFPNNTIKELLL